MKTVIMFLLVVSIAIGGYMYYDNVNERETEVLERKKRSVVKYQSVSEFGEYGPSDLALVVSSDGSLYGFINKNYDEVIPCIYDKILYYHNQKFMVVLKGQCMLISEKGDVIKQFNYTNISDFFNDKFAVAENGIYYGGQKCCIDMEGNQLSRFYDEIYPNAPDKETGYIRVVNNGKWGYINENFQEIVPCKYDGMSGYEEGMANIYMNGKWGYVNPQGEVVVPAIYRFSEPYENGYVVLHKDNKCGVLDKIGNPIIPFIYTDIYQMNNNRFRVKQGNYRGIIDISGNVIVPIIYDEVKKTDGFYYVEQDGKCGFLDENGKVLIPIQYDDVNYVTSIHLSFREGLAPVGFDDKVGYINKKGEIIIPALSRNDYFADYNFYDGLAVAERNGKWGYMNKTGKIVIPCVYDYSCRFSSGIGHVSLNGKGGIIDTKGEMITACIYDLISFPQNKEEPVLVLLNGKYGYINRMGETVIPCIYTEAECFEDGLAIVSQDATLHRLNINTGVETKANKGLWGCINVRGDVVIPFEYDKIYMDVKFCGGLIGAYKNGKNGYLEKHTGAFFPRE